MKSINLLITGGAGFIGSNLVKFFLEDKRVALVRVLDDLSNGYYENIEEFEEHPKFEFIKGDICDYKICMKACMGIHKISHQAALGSVPRSIENPMRTNEVNVGGTVNLLHAAKACGVQRIVLACSSSTYGDSKALPKEEGRIGNPLSPYAVSKLAVEIYADVFQKTFGLDYIGLRYFNVFGPRQNPSNPYAAVIPIFCQAFIDERRPTINGDGFTSRDFTFVENAVHANELALFSENKEAINEVYNVACGNQVTLNEMVEVLQQHTDKDIKPTYGPERSGDVKHSRADISKIKRLLNYEPKVHFAEGLSEVYQWYKKNQVVHNS